MAEHEHSQPAHSRAAWLRGRVSGGAPGIADSTLDVTMFTSVTLDPADLLAVLSGAGFSISPARRVRRTVLDTFDGRVAGAGLRLELCEDPSPELVLFGGGTVPARVLTSGAPRHAADLPAGPFRLRLSEILGVRALVATLTLTARETTATKRDRDGKARVGVTLHDQVAVDGHGPIPNGGGVEVDEVAGYADDAEKARVLLLKMGLQPSAGDLVDLVGASAGVALGGFKISPTVPLRRAEPAERAFRRLLANLAGTVEITWAGTVEDVDAEFLHDLRVAVRRTRSLLAESKGVLPADVRRRYREEFKWLGAVTGRPRDLDVYVMEWDGYIAPLGLDAAELAPVLDHITQERQAAHTTLAADLRSDRYRTLMSGWQAWLRDPTSIGSGPEAQLPICEIATSRTADAQRRLLDRGRSIGPDSPAEELHELRKDAKKLRYLLECFGSLYAPTKRKAFVQILKALQENLGEHQDTEVHVSELRTITQELHRQPGAPATLVAVGQLIEHLERRRRAARDEFAVRFAAYDTKATRRSLRDLLLSAGGR